MTENVGIWIDHAHAVIVHASVSGVRAETLESHLESHHRYSTRAGDPSHDNARDEGGEKKYEERFGQKLDTYYDAVIDHLGDAGAVFILGPGEAKLQLKERMGRSKSLSHTIVGVETADRLTEPQIVAKVKEHYGITA